MDDKRTPMEAEVQELPDRAAVCPPGDSYGTAARPKPQRSYAWFWISVGLVVIGLCTFGVAASLSHVRVDRSNGSWRLAMQSTEETGSPEETPVRDLDAPQTGSYESAVESGTGTLRLSVENRSREGLSPDQIYEKVSPAVVCVEMETYYGTVNATGVVVTADGYILSASEGLTNVLSLTVCFPDGSSAAARRVGEEKNTGVCLLKVEGSELPTVSFSDGQDLTVGQSAYCVCNPYGAAIPNVFYEGVLSACQSVELGGNSYTLLQSSAQLREVGYGCPILDSQGRVLGLTTPVAAQLSGGSGAELAISAGDLVPMVMAFDGSGSGEGLWLGLEVEDIPETYLYLYGFPGSLWISQIPAGSALSEVLCPYDVITELDGTPVESAAAFQQLLDSHSPGDRVKLTIFRSGKWYSIRLLVCER